jgi:hypothetical protein
MQYSAKILINPFLHTLEHQLYSLPPDIQTDLESKPFNRLPNFWCLFYRKKTPLSGAILVYHSKPGVQAVFLYLQNVQQKLLRQNGHISGTVGRIDARIWTHFHTRKTV